MSRIYPAIDLIKGQVVRLTKGAFDQVSLYHLDPVAVAESYRDAGATYLHVVDLDGARHAQNRQLDLIRRIVQATNLKVQTGGGIRNYEDVKQLLDQGVDRVILGSIAVNDPETTKKIIQRATPSRITLGLDVKQDEEGTYRVAIDGWQKLSLQSAFVILEFYQAIGIEVVLCTDVSRDGTGRGPNFNLYQELRERYGKIGFLASGGVGSLDDIIQAKKMELYGIVIGKALYEKKVELKEVLSC